MFSLFRPPLTDLIMNLGSAKHRVAVLYFFLITEGRKSPTSKIHYYLQQLFHIDKQGPRCNNFSWHQETIFLTFNTCCAFCAMM